MSDMMDPALNFEVSGDYEYFARLPMPAGFPKPGPSCMRTGQHDWIAVDAQEFSDTTRNGWRVITHAHGAYSECRACGLRQ